MLGAMLADVPHTRPISVFVTSENAAVRTEFGIERSTYEGPVGILSVLGEAAEKAGMPTLSIWASVPHYVHNAPSPKATLALIDKLEEIIDIVIPRGELLDEAATWESGIDALASEDEDMSNYIEQLEQASDTVDSPEASGEAIAHEFEKYLRGNGDEKPEGGSAGEGPWRAERLRADAAAGAAAWRCDARRGAACAGAGAGCVVRGAVCGVRGAAFCGSGPAVRGAGAGAALGLRCVAGFAVLGFAARREIRACGGSCFSRRGWVSPAGRGVPGVRPRVWRETTCVWRGLFLPPWVSFSRRTRCAGRTAAGVAGDACVWRELFLPPWCARRAVARVARCVRVRGCFSRRG